ncbi:hypothetical protein ONZ45_g6520 [Pleurotus djamor]|nr:hypothetical protein ONZ45_g6520 [Pleurotus djamor]
MASGSSGMTSYTSGTSSLGAFSDEYDLYPQVLHDVQKALKLKARREARIRAGLPPHLPRNLPSSPSSSVSSPPRPTIYRTSPITSPSPSPQRRPILTNSEVDFGPSTVASNTPVTPHPVPSSIDDGDTLDWAGDASDDEKSDKRWSLSIHRRKGKDKAANISNVDLKKADDDYQMKLIHLKSSASPQSLRKAEIISQQLGRRYKLVYDRLETPSVRLNPLKIYKWLEGQDALTRSGLEHAEPFTWLRHLEKRRVHKDGPKFPWHLSALAMERYCQSQHYEHFMETIPESPSASPTGVILNVLPPIDDTLGLPLPTDRPAPGSGRNSFDVDSRRSGESVYSAISNPVHPPPPASPTASLSHLRGMSTRMRRNLPTSEGKFSAPHSMSDASDNDRRSPVPRPRVKRRRPSDLHVILSRLSVEPPMKDPPKEPLEDDDGVTPSSAVMLGHIVPGVIPYTGAEPPGLIASRLASPTVPDASRRKPRISTKSSMSLLNSQEKRQAEERLREEYDHKFKLMEELNAQNTRVRQTLNRIATIVREHDTLQGNLMNMLGAPHTGMPPDVLDAFGHDPSAVTGSTRKLRGFRAVEDIHNRVLRQRRVLEQYIYSADEKTPGPIRSVLNDPIMSLTRSLGAITAQHEEIVVKAHEVAKVLKDVKALHGEVKVEYNDTLAHTSVVYPELSYIVALEESYKDQYQQVWEFGMDALTFLLDQVTPLWRTYGKTIGVDVQDFLIIPLYRNEFTGEPKRYPIKHLPRRSCRHWLGFCLFFFISAAVCILQLRAALTSSRHYSLHIIAHSGFRWLIVPFFLVVILIQWSAVLVEFLIVLMQLAVATWWIGWMIRVLD